MLVREGVEKISKFLLHRLQDISIWSDKNDLFGSIENQTIAFHKVTFVWKEVHIVGTFLDSLFKESWLHVWKVSNYTACRKSRKK